MSATTAWNTVVSLTLAAVTTAVRGSPLPSQTKCSLDPGLPRSTGFAPRWSPTLGPHAHGVHAHPLPVQLALGTKAVQDPKVQGIEHPASAHSVSRRQQVDGEPQPSSRAGSSRHGVDVRAMKTIAAKQARSEMVRYRPPYG